MTFRPSVVKMRILCLLAGIVCAIFVSALIQQNPANIEANVVPTEKFFEEPNPDCGKQCDLEVGCSGDCSEEEGDCCTIPGKIEASCLYCGP